MDCVEKQDVAACPVISIAIVGRRSLLRAGLFSLLNSCFESVEHDDFQLLKEIGAKLIVLCLVQEPEDIVKAVGAMRTCNAMARIVFVLPSLNLIFQCYADGAAGCVLEAISSEALRLTIKLVAAGEKVFPSEMVSLLTSDTVKNHNAEEKLGSPISRRETDILECLASGNSNKEIGRTLGIAEATVKVHLKRILRKANVSNRTQAALWAVATGIVPPSSSKLPTI